MNFVFYCLIIYSNRHEKTKNLRNLREIFRQEHKDKQPPGWGVQPGGHCALCIMHCALFKHLAGSAVAHLDNGDARCVGINALASQVVACHLMGIAVTDVGDARVGEVIDAEGGADNLLLPVARSVLQAEA